MPKSDILLQFIRKHLEKKVEDWEAPVEGHFILEDGPYDYDISDLDVDENHPIARTNINNVRDRSI